MPGRFGIGELAIILVIILILFGPKRLPDLARSLGQAIGEFKKGQAEFENELKRPLDEESKPKETAQNTSNAQADNNTNAQK